MIEWYYRDSQSHKVGPLTANQFEVCVIVGEIRPDTEVWRSGLTSWTTYEDLQSFDESSTPQSRSRHAARAPRSSTYRTLIALGASPTHRRPARARLTTSGCTPHGVAEPLWLEPVAAADSLPAVKADPILDRTGTDAIWLGRQMMRIALAGAVFVLAHSVWVERTASRAVLAPAARAEPTVLLGPLEGTLSSLSTATASPAVVP